MRGNRWKSCALLAALVVATGAPPARASVAPGAALKTCFWTDVAGTGGRNILLPDAAGTYWYTRFVLPPGGKVVLRGEYPHARSFFLWSYQLLTPFDGLHDRRIAPDPGSTNPFLPAADRTADWRNFTITVTGQSPPAPGRRAANTIYAGSAVVQLIYRVYLPDEGRARTGDAGLPDAQYVTPLGLRLSGRSACAALLNGRAAFPDVLPLLTPAYLALLALSPTPTHPAVTTVNWYSLINDARLAEPFFAGTPLAGLISGLPVNRTGLAVAPDADSALAYSYVDRSLGPNPGGHNVLVLRGRLPSTPRTRDGDATMSGPTDMRYWSLCQNDSFVLGRVGDCLYDEEVPTDPQGRYTIVVSLPEDRPANATRACGVAWLDYGTLGDGVLKPRAGLLLLRNQLSDPSFAASLANVSVPGAERAVLGDYLPTGDYRSRDEFTARGCG